MDGTLTIIPLKDIVAGDNDRKVFEPCALRELADSMAAQGLAQPVIVRPLSTLAGMGYQLVAGERRTRAARLLEWETIPAIVRSMTDEEASALMLAENTSRESLDPIEEAHAYKKRISEEVTDIVVAQQAGVSIDRVRRRLMLLALADDVQHLVASGNLPIGHAEVLSQLDHNRQMIALRVFGKSAGMPLSTFRGFVGQLVEEQAQESLFDLETFWTQVVERSKEIPHRGKRAVTGAPVRADLPPVVVERADSAGQVFDRWIGALIAAGLSTEAATVGTLYNVLVHWDFVATPLASCLLIDDPKPEKQAASSAP